MKIKFRFFMIALASLFSFESSVHSAPVDPPCEVSLFEGMGDLHFKITTTNAEAQKYFDQGLTWSYGFNHAEATRSFRKAADLDGSCAMCYWGMAYVLGPNINAPMEPSVAPDARKAVEKAQQLMETSRVTPRERALITALTKRYAAEAPADRSPLDQAYADAMKEVAQNFPDDPDVLSLFAEAVMDTMPWDYWTADREPKPEIIKILDALSTAMKINPRHVGANHFYIHALEAVRPKLAEQAADRLLPLVPAAGHLIHMPSHIYIRVGRYHDASASNERAIESDRAYLNACHAGGMYEAMYIPHNYDFLVASAYLEGRSEVAINAARKLQKYIEPHLDHMPEMYDLQHFWANYYWALLRFGRWQDILAASAPREDLLYARTMWHTSRAMAFIRLSDLAKARQEIKLLETLARHPALAEARLMGLNKASAIVAIGVEELKGEYAAAQGRLDDAVAHLKKAVELQDGLIYIEPPSWYHSVRLALGEVLLAAGRGAEAENVFRTDLKHFPANGRALLGLARSHEAQGEDSRATWARAEFRKAWRYADVELSQARP